MEKLTRLTTEQRENLAAYLDGELDDDATRQIETALAQSTVARNDVEMLARTYELLEMLPRPRASQEFSEKTLAVAKLTDVRADFRRSRWYRATQRGLRWTGWAAILVAAACASYGVARYRLPRHENLLLDDLDVIQKFDRYEEAGEVFFLERLGRDAALLEKMTEESGRAIQ
ncbi:MAG: hypothetical protein KF774_07260 [Planctomyces sp.]|nr:hypothetical protein [Planctomyces sp.]